MIVHACPPPQPSQAWKTKWWKLHSKLHYNELAFEGATAVGFVRIECYGSPDSPESGWLEGLRIHPDFSGKGIMTRINDAVFSRVPPAVRRDMYLAVGSANERMCAISDSKYEYIGGYCMHRFTQGAAPPAR